MNKRDRVNKVVSEIGIGLATLVMMVPIYYFLISAFKARKDIIKFPLVINAELFTLENFPYVIKKIQYWKALGNTAFITFMALIIIIVSASLAGFAIARIKSRGFSTFYKLIVTLMVIPFIGCLLPLTENRGLSTELGTRHRAALGLSEQCDAVVVIVSEETGIVSIAENGHITRRLNSEQLKKRLRPLLIKADPTLKMKDIKNVFDTWRKNK